MVIAEDHLKVQTGLRRHCTRKTIIGKPNYNYVRLDLSYTGGLMCRMPSKKQYRIIQEN